jgi:menaquinone-dependent protoporphyrinogen oxidase
MSKTLVAYATKSGSTAEVATAIGAALAGAGVEVEVRPAADVELLDGYDAVVLGGPRVTSLWHPGAMAFLRRFRAELARRPVAFFMTSITLTRVEDPVGSIPVVLDPAHARPPRRAERLGWKEKMTTPAAYLAPVLRRFPDVVPVEVAFLAGKLDFATVGFLHRLFFKLVLGLGPCDLRNWSFIDAWARRLGPALGASAPSLAA